MGFLVWVFALPSSVKANRYTFFSSIPLINSMCFSLNSFVKRKIIFYPIFRNFVTNKKRKKNNKLLLLHFYVFFQGQGIFYAFFAHHSITTILQFQTSCPLYIEMTRISIIFDKITCPEVPQTKKTGTLPPCDWLKFSTSHMIPKWRTSKQ